MATTEDPESLLNAWLDELDTITVGLENALRPPEMTSDLNTPRIDSYRFSQANLEESQDVDLDAILDELCALGVRCEEEIAGARLLKSRTDLDQNGSKTTEGRTDSPDNDSAFSDNVSMLSSESSASSGASKASSGFSSAESIKSEKIRIALEKMREASVKKLFIKAFTSDGSTKSLLVDEKMTCSHVARLLADKNHVIMDPKWAVVEHLPDLYMERIYEDHELLVDNLMLWTRDSPNRILFVERRERTQLFTRPERFLLASDSSSSDLACLLDEDVVGGGDAQAQAMLLDEFFSHAHVPDISGLLYLKADSRKCWKRYHFVLRASGLYYYPKEKSKSLRDLQCLASFDVNQVYYGVGWRKKYKAPTDHCFAIKHPRLQQSKTSKYVKYLCAEDDATLQRWVVGIRIAKYGRQLLDNYRTILDDMAQEDLDQLANARSCSTTCIANGRTSISTTSSSDEGETKNNRRGSVSSHGSRDSSSSSSGCHSDGVSVTSSEPGFVSDFPCGTIKRKPTAVQPKLPLTTMTRQLIEVGENAEGVQLTRRASWRRSNQMDQQQQQQSENSSSTLTRRISFTSKTSSSGGGTDTGSNQSTLTRKPRNVSAKLTAAFCQSVVKSTGEAKNTSIVTDASRTLDEAINSLTVHQNQCDPQHHLKNVNVDFEDALERNLEAISDQSSSFGEDDDFPDDVTAQQQSDVTDAVEPALPPPPEMFESTLSLDSLPPPPSQSELPVFDDVSCSSLSLASLPPFPRIGSPKSDLSTPVSSGGATPTNQGSNSGEVTPICGSTPTKVFSPGSPIKSCVPTKPPLRPKATRVTFSPNPPSRLPPPPNEFLQDLQRVMRKKWQIAQKCAMENPLSPHEVLSFRDPPADPAHERASNWVQRHYGQSTNAVYENTRTDLPPRPPPSLIMTKKRPPPPPPKRSETTQLSCPRTAR